MAVKPGIGRRIIQKVGAVRTGIILLIIVGIVSAAGTVILQRPVTDPQDMERAYAPGTLRALDAMGLTDVYHTWWFGLLLALLAISIIFASIERWPNAWRYYARPYRRTDASFRAVLPLQSSIPIGDPGKALDAAERALKTQGLKAERIVEHDEVSLYAEKSRFAVMAVYVVHASLLLIMLGGIVDGLFSYKGYLNLVPGLPAVTALETRDGSVRKLPFSVRCDGAGQENYTGEYAMMPKRWWSKLTVIENGQEVLHKEISVNDPLVYRSVRFYQSGFGTSGQLERAQVAVVTPDSAGQPQILDITVGATATANDGTTIKVAKFIPDAYPMGNEFYQKSKDLNNPALLLEVTPKGRATQSGWLLLNEEASRRNDLVLSGLFDAQGTPVAGTTQYVARLQMAPFTGLQVSHEPGQWAIWAGCLLMGLGLFLAFWVLHQRYWVVPVTNKEGKLVLWVGAAANKNREGFEVRFREVAAEIEKEITTGSEPIAAMTAASAVRG